MQPSVSLPAAFSIISVHSTRVQQGAEEEELGDSKVMPSL